MATTKKATTKASDKAKTVKAEKAPAKTAVKAPAKAAAKAKTVAVKAPKEVKAPKVEKAPKAEPKKLENNGNALPEEKQKIIEKFAQKNGDTGSPEVQVALLSHKIGRLIEHLEINKKDNHSRRGLLKVVAKRRRILNYLVKIDKDRYQHLIGELGLKK